MQHDGQPRRASGPADRWSERFGRWPEWAIAALLTAALLPTVSANWQFAATLWRILGPYAERVSLAHMYPGIPEVVDALQARPDRRVFCVPLRDASSVTEFSYAKGLPSRLMEMLYPRPVLEYDAAEVRAGDLLVVDPGFRVEVPVDEVVRGQYAVVLQVRP